MAKDLQVVLRRGLLPLAAPLRRALRGVDHLDRPAAGDHAGDVGAADEAQARVIEIVAVEIVDHGRQRAGADERVQDLVVEEDIHGGHGLVGVVLAHLPVPVFGIVGLADARQQQQPHVLQDVGGQDHHLRGLEELLAGAVHIGDAGGPLAVGRQLDLEHLAFGLQREVGLAPSGRAGSSSAGSPWNSCRSRTSRRSRNRCTPELGAERIHVRLRHVSGRMREWMVPELGRRLGEQRRRVGLAIGGVGIFARARPLERIAAGLDLALQVAGLAAGAAQLVELVVVAAPARPR